jgi:hypothetical protein
MSAHPNSAMWSTAPAMTSGDMGEKIGASPSLPRLCRTDAGSERDRGDAARVPDGRYPAKRPLGDDDLGPWRVDPTVAQVAALVSDTGYMLVRSSKDTRRLVAEISRAARDYPIVGIALRNSEAVPALTPQEVRTVAGERARIYLIIGDFLLRRLERAQGAKLGPAWVWWPACSTHNAGGGNTFQQFAREFELSRPVVRSEIERLVDVRASVERELAEARESSNGLKRDLRAAELDGLRATARAEAAKLGLEEARAYLGSLKDAGLGDDELRTIAQMNPEDRLHRLIFREWMRLTPSDRREHQLSYSFGVRFVATIEEHRDIPRDRLAWVCAMVACGRKPAGLDVHALRKGDGGNNPQVVRADGAKAWRARITTSAPNTPAATRLHFWTHVGGGAGIEFGSVGSHDSSIRGM